MIEREAVSMRIYSYIAVIQVYKTSAYAKDKSIALKKTEKDKYELSDTAKVYNTARTAVNEASDVRLDKVNDIKARMSAGTYNISSEADIHTRYRMYINITRRRREQNGKLNRLFNRRSY